MRSATLTTLAVLCFAITSCSTSFEKNWRAALAKPVPTKGVEGPWQGTWLSHGNGHHGQLRCVVGPALDAKGTHSFQYHATWAHLLSGTFTAPHVVVPQGDAAGFKGSHKLGKLGMFDYDGTVKGSEFIATYKAAGDHGVFEMKRPKSPRP